MYETDKWWLKMESIYNIEALIYELEKIRKEEGNREVYIRDTYSSGEYLRISEIWLNGGKDVIIDIDTD